MNFDQSRRQSPGPSSDGHSEARISEGAAKVDEKGDSRELPKVSSKKAEANRNNARKSTGPRTSRGKSRARLNALKHGAFARQRLIQGEDESAYRRLADQIFAEARPRTAIETMLADQIVGDMWRLKRIEQAERAYFEQIRAAALARALRSLSTEEKKLVPNVVDAILSPTSGSVGEISCALERKLHAAVEPEKLMLDGMVSPDGAFPYSCLEQIRRSLVRDVLRKAARLGELQDDQLTIASNRF